MSMGRSLESAIMLDCQVPMVGSELGGSWGG